ncbi:MAG: SRPBCC family protein [Proteobacteria bacterium]|nr:SRPBCC family protein [Pseudomonadota bacterium]
MSNLKIEERFRVQAPPERVWTYLLDPEEIVVCLPGATLLEVEGERTYHGQMTIKVGPVTVAYKGTINLSEVDEETRRIQMIGTGKEKGGAGSAKMTMNSHLEAEDGGTTAVVVEADVKLAGRIVRFGRGMIQSVSKQLFKQFADNLRELIESGPDRDTGSESARGSTGDNAGDTDAGTEPAEQAGAEPAGHERGSAPDQSVDSATGPASSDRAESDATADEKSAEKAGSVRQLAAREVEPIRALPLLFRALWDSIAGLFRRLFGRRRD